MDTVYFCKSYSQYGEDLLLASFLHNVEQGFYVDVGAHHPLRFSNTQYFYERGWHGINIDATPGSMARFHKYRTRDINLECGVGREAGLLDFYMFNEPALNGFSQELSQKREQATNIYHIERVVAVAVKPLAHILDVHLPKGIRIDFLSIDAEGLDESVLMSNNWDVHRPHFVLVEMLKKNGINIEQSPTTQIMTGYQYEAVAVTFNSVLFQDATSQLCNRE